jgi:hypothetical protein
MSRLAIVRSCQLLLTGLGLMLRLRFRLRLGLGLGRIGLGFVRVSGQCTYFRQHFIIVGGIR